MGNQPNEEGGLVKDYDKLAMWWLKIQKYYRIYSPSSTSIVFSNNPLVEEFLFSENNTTIADVQMEKTNAEKVIKAFNLIINRFPDQLK